MLNNWHSSKVRTASVSGDEALGCEIDDSEIIGTDKRHIYNYNSSINIGALQITNHIGIGYNIPLVKHFSFF